MLSRMLLACAVRRGGVVTAPPPPQSGDWISSAEDIHAFYLWDRNGLGGMSYAQLAARFDLTWNTTSATTVSNLIAIKPDIKLGHYMAYEVDMQDPKQTLSWWQANHPTWVVYQADQVTVPNPFGDGRIYLDITNQEVIDWQVAQFAQAAASAGWGAISADEFSLNNDWGAVGHFDAGGNWVQLYSGAYTDSTFKDAQIAWLTNFRAAIHALSNPLLLVPNYNIGPTAWNDSYAQQVIANTDGILDENSFTNTGGSWPSAQEMYDALNFGISAQQQGVYFGALFYPAASSNVVDDRNAYWAIACFMVMNEGLCSICAVASGSSEPYYHPWMATPIGTAGGAYATPATNVYTRQYSAGFAILNTDGSSHSVTLPSGSWKDLNGNVVTSPYSLAAQTAIVLVPV